jgi:membrane-associated phospholipid phosphatase
MKPGTFVDYAAESYLVLVGLVVLLFHGKSVPQWPLFVLGHALCPLLIAILIRAHARHPANRVLEVLRYFYPVLLYPAFYCETGAINRMFFADYLDPFFIRLDAAVFGFQPCLAFMARLPYLAVSEVLYAAYFSYYIMIVGVGVALFIRRREEYFHYVSVVSFVFYVCYLLYIVMPVMGPRIFYSEAPGYDLPADLQALAVPYPYPHSVEAGPFYGVMKLIYRYFEAPGAAFPSSHAAVAVVTLFFTYRYLRPIRLIHSVAVVLLCLATVYCRYHYAVDIVAGILTAAILTPLGNRLYFRFSQSGVKPSA